MLTLEPCGVNRSQIWSTICIIPDKLTELMVVSASKPHFSGSCGTLSSQLGFVKHRSVLPLLSDIFSQLSPCCALPLKIALLANCGDTDNMDS
jgi:hypothetical protein